MGKREAVCLLPEVETDLEKLFSQEYAELRVKIRRRKVGVGSILRC